MNNLSSNQSEAIARLQEWKVGALFMEAGTGKTRVAVELVNSVPDIDLVLWIGPLRTLAGDGCVPDEVVKWGDFNHPAVEYIGIESIGQSDRIYTELLDRLHNYKHIFCVVDESLKIKNFNAKRTRRALEIGKTCEYKLILNGTPLSRNLLDLWAQMQFLSPRILSMDLRQFKKSFCNYVTVDRGAYSKEYITSYANIDYLCKLIGPYVYECGLTLSVKQRYHDVHYDLDDNTRSVYTEKKDFWLSSDILEELNDNIFMAMTTDLQQCYSQCDDKMAKCDEVIRRSNADRVVIFTRYIASAEACRKKWPKVQVLSYQKEAYGLNLQRYNVTIYFDKVWDYALRLQSSRRTYRVGQVLDCEYYDITGNVGLEKIFDRCIDKKMSMSDYFKQTSTEQLKQEL